MAELMIKIKRDNIPDPSFQDGDIIAAMNNRRIKDVHVQHICKDNRELLEYYLNKVMQYKFVRTGKIVKRIIIATSQEEDVSNQMDVALFIKRRLAHPKHNIFGTKDNEVWYGGRTKADLNTLSNIWTEIESKTMHREANYTKWVFTDGELKNYLCITVDDFDDETRGELEVSEYDNTDPENPIMIKKRKNKVDWKNTLGLIAKNIRDIEAKGIKVDLRTTTTFTRSNIVEVK